MAKAAKFLILLVTATILSVGCRSQARADSDKPLIYASFYPMYDFAQKAAGDLAEVRCLIPDGTEAHDWEPTARDIVGLSGADLFFYSGEGFETWVPSVISQLGETVEAVETGAGLDLSDAVDPHIWLSPQNAKHQFTAMCEALKAVDIKNAELYGENQKRWSDEFDKLDLELRELETLKSDKLLVTHGAFGHLCKAYGLEQIAIIGYSPDAEPDPAAMAAAVRTAREYGITTVFYEGSADYNTALAISSETGAKLKQLSPLEGLTDEQRANGDDYFSLMRKNLAAIKEGLS